MACRMSSPNHPVHFDKLNEHCHPSNRGIFYVVIYNNDFIYCITHNSLFAFQSLRQRRSKDTEALEVTLRKESRVCLSPPFAFESLRQRRSKDTEALEVPLRKESRVCLSPPFAFESLRQRGSAVRHSIFNPVNPKILLILLQTMY
jgi:hypothetical protein